jgi:hypothetical protein
LYDQACTCSHIASQQFAEFNWHGNMDLKLIFLQVPLKSLAIDGNCRVDDRGLETHHGHVRLKISLFYVVAT